MAEINELLAAGCSFLHHQKQMKVQVLPTASQVSHFLSQHGRILWAGCSGRVEIAPLRTPAPKPSWEQQLQRWND